MKSRLDICVLGALVYDHCQSYTRIHNNCLTRSRFLTHCSRDLTWLAPNIHQTIVPEVLLRSVGRCQFKNKFKSSQLMLAHFFSFYTMNNDNTADLKAACGCDLDACIFSKETQNNRTHTLSKPVWNAVIMPQKWQTRFISRQPRKKNEIK